MKKKFLIPILGVFVCAMSFTFTNNSSTNDASGLFIESDNIALAESYGSGRCQSVQDNVICLKPEGGWENYAIRAFR